MAATFRNNELGDVYQNYRVNMVPKLSQLAQTLMEDLRKFPGSMLTIETIFSDFRSNVTMQVYPYGTNKFFIQYTRSTGQTLPQIYFDPNNAMDEIIRFVQNNPCNIYFQINKYNGEYLPSTNFTINSAQINLFK